MSRASVRHSIRAILKRLVCALERSSYLTGARSLKRLTLPHFLGLGPGQTGTTWLFKHLSSHPDVFFCEKKETNYFDREYHAWPLSYYASLFAAGRDLIRGEITPGYSLLRRDRIACVRKIVPDVRLILIVRNPVERSWSAARRLMPKLGWKPDETPDEQLYDYFQKEWAYTTEGVAALEGHYEPGLLEGHYTRIIDNWLSVFPREQLLVVFFDEMKTNPEEFLRKVCAHIGVRGDIEWSADLDQPVNTNPKHAIPDRFRRFLEDQYGAEIEALRARFGEAVDAWTAPRSGGS